MPAFESDLRTCLEEVLRAPVPAVPDGDEPIRFLSHWLAERNLGLVPIEDAASFAWAGWWIGVVPGNEARHAVVMFGSPAGVWLDPAGVYRDQSQIEAGWMLAPLDLHLSTAQPYGAAAGAGTVAGVLLAPDAEAGLARVESAQAITGRGLEGDRYATGRGTFSVKWRGYELTLVEAEVLDEIDLSWEDARRNIVTRGIALNALVGRRFRIGEVECVGRRLAEPCSHLERLARPGLLRPLVHRGGLRADILTGGLVRVGDDVSAIGQTLL